MESVIKKLENKKVIDKHDILTIKAYIEKKYTSYSSVQKSAVLTKAVHQILDNSIRGLDENTSQSIKCEVLKNTLLGNSDAISLEDIFNASVNQKNKSEDFTEKLTSWVNLHVEDRVSKEDIEKFSNNDNAEYNTEHNNEPAIKFTEDMGKSTDTYNYNLEGSKSFYGVLTNYIGLRKMACLLFLFMFSVLAVQKININYSNVFQKKMEAEKINSAEIIKEVDMDIKAYDKKMNLWRTSNLPKDFLYKDINKTALQSFLVKRNSILSEEPYFSTIISVSKEYNLNPLVLFAICGQEQGFVPKQDSDSKKIANNPFNVYVSWQKYNTSIEDASRIACVTIINLCKDRPDSEQAFKWINRQYSEDKNWYKGVSEIYKKLVAEQ